MSRIQVTEKTVFKFEELSDAAKEKAREWWRRCEDEAGDNDYLRDDVEKIAEILGIEFDAKPVKLMGGGTRYDPKIWWSGFSSQGDGACFEGRYSYAKGSVKKMKAYAPLDEELHRIASELFDLQRKNFYKLEARMTHSGHYYHSGCMRVEVFKDGSDFDRPEIDDDIRQLMRDFADWIYSQLEANYEWRMSNENVDESILCNEYEFDEDGRRA